MAVFKDKWGVYKGNAWQVVFYYTDWRGERVRHQKRGFATKHEAVQYEHNFLAKQTKDIKMGFNEFIDIYMDEMKPQLKKTTFANKEQIINKHIRPYFSKLSLSEISPTHMSNIKTGTTRVSLTAIVSLANALSVTVKTRQIISNQDKQHQRFWI